MTPECKAYVAEKCVKLMKSPYVCNGCPGKPNCNLEKHVYRADRADVEYKDVLSETWAAYSASNRTGVRRMADSWAVNGGHKS